tara:strand:+ start:570 stop:716 length:147 start_codon:yes stop_codon:yes gene_type:complete
MHTYYKWDFWITPTGPITLDNLVKAYFIIDKKDIQSAPYMEVTPKHKP